MKQRSAHRFSCAASAPQHQDRRARPAYRSSVRRTCLWPRWQGIVARSYRREFAHLHGFRDVTGFQRPETAKHPQPRSRWPHHRPCEQSACHGADHRRPCQANHHALDYRLVCIRRRRRSARRWHRPGRTVFQFRSRNRVSAVFRGLRLRSASLP